MQREGGSAESWAQSRAPAGLKAGLKAGLRRGSGSRAAPPGPPAPPGALSPPRPQRALPAPAAVPAPLCPAPQSRRHRMAEESGVCSFVFKKRVRAAGSGRRKRPGSDQEQGEGWGTRAARGAGAVRCGAAGRRGRAWCRPSAAHTGAWPPSPARGREGPRQVCHRDLGWVLGGGSFPGRRLDTAQAPRERSRPQGCPSSGSLWTALPGWGCWVSVGVPSSPGLPQARAVPLTPRFPRREQRGGGQHRGAQGAAAGHPQPHDPEGKGAPRGLLLHPGLPAGACQAQPGQRWSLSCPPDQALHEGEAGLRAEQQRG